MQGLQKRYLMGLKAFIDTAKATSVSLIQQQRNGTASSLKASKTRAARRGPNDYRDAADKSTPDRNATDLPKQ